MRFRTFLRQLFVRPAPTPFQRPYRKSFLLLCLALLLLAPAYHAFGQNGHVTVAASSTRPSRTLGLGQIAGLPDTDLRGTLHIVSQDLPKQHILSYFLSTEGSSIELHFITGDPAGFMTGDQIKVHGKLAGDHFYLLSADSMTKIGATLLSPSGPLALSSPNTFGNQTTLVLLVNFIDDTSQPLDPDVVNDIVFSGTDAFYREVSQNQTWVTGTVYPTWFTVPLSSKTCAFTDLARLADSAAKSDGVDLAAYKHVIYAFHTTACDFIGASYLGGNRIWANGDIRVEVIAHELGHNLGLYHSHALDCSGVSTGPSCTKVEYGDTFDVMGDTLAAHFNAYQKERLGYLNYGSSLPLTTVTTSGIYPIAPYEFIDGSKALKIVTDLNPASGLYNLLYVEYRQNLGQDTSLVPYPDATAGVLIHQTSSVRADSSYLLDLHPLTNTFDDAALLPGETFTEPQSGTSIQLLSADENGASVRVVFGQDACAYNQPTVTFSPSSYTVGPGATVNFTVTIKNNNGPTCDDSTFNLTNSNLPGFTATLDKSSITLAHGASGQATLTVTSDLATVSGNYRFFLLAKDNASSGLSGAGSGSYIVSTPFSLSASQTSVVVAQGGSSTINVTSSINSPFSSAVSLSISGAPSGVTTSFSSAGFPAPGSGKSVLSVLVAPYAVPGVYSLTITGTGGGLTQQVPLTLTINSSGNFNLSVSPTTLNVARGSSDTVIVASNVVGSFSSNVTLSISGLPSSVTASFSPSSIPNPGSGMSTLTFTADNSASVGSTYMLTISGTGSGLTRTTPISVTITGAQLPPPPGITSIPVTGYKLVSADSQEMQCGIHSAIAAFDGNPKSFWESQDCLATVPLPHELQIDLGATYNLAGFKYLPRQDSQPTGKVRNFRFYVSNSTQDWGNPVTTGTLITVGSDIGEKQVLFDSALSGRYIRFVAVSEVNGGQIATIAELIALQTSTPPPPPINDFALSAHPSTVTVLQGNSITTKITSTLSGTFSSSIALSASGMPNGVTATFNPTPIAAPGSGDSTLTFNTNGASVGSYPVTVTGIGGGKTHSITVTLAVTSQDPPPPGLTPIPQADWKLTYVDSQESQCGLFVGTFAFDGKPNTYWQTQTCLGGPAQPHEIRIDLGATYTIKGFRYLPRQDGLSTGKIADFEFYVSADGVNWGLAAATGTLITVPTDIAEKQVVFNAPVSGRYVRLKSISEVNGGKVASMAELNVLQ